MKMMKTLLAAAVVAASVPAMAATYQAGDIMVKAGAITVQPTNDAVDILASGNIDAASVSLEVSNNTQLGVTATYMFHSNWGVEVLAATPFTHNVRASAATDQVNVAPTGTKIAEVEHLPPTVSIQYYPLGDEASVVQPYIGAGINYTTFLDVKDSANLGTKDLKDSWGLAYSAGVNVHLNDNWMANVAVWKIDIDTKIEGGTANGAAVTIDPTVFLVGVGYKF